MNLPKINACLVIQRLLSWLAYDVGVGGGAGGKVSADLWCAERAVNWPLCGNKALSGANTPGSALLEMIIRSRRSTLFAEGVLKEGNWSGLNRSLTPV